jgi:hypothetical protein
MEVSLMSRVDQLPTGIVPWVNGELAPAIIHTAINVVGLVGHTLVLTSFIGAKLQPSMYLTLTLSISDFMMLTTCLVVNVSNLTVNGFYGGASMCTWETKMVLFACFASVFALLSTTFERYLHIIHQKEVTKSQVLIWIGTLWVSAFVVGWFPVFFGREASTYGLQSGLVHCTLAWWSIDGPAGAFTLFACVATISTFLACSGVMIFCYYRIVITYIKATRSVKHQSLGVQASTLSAVGTQGKSGTDTATTNSAATGFQVPLQGKKKVTMSKQEKMLLTKAILLTMSFLTMWTPYFLKIVAEMIMKVPAPPIIDHICNFGAAGNSMMNSFLLLSLDFRIKNKVKAMFGLDPNKK